MNRFMRVLVFFDLPVKTKKQRKVANNFRKYLINQGFIMMQLSIYSRICNGPDSVEKYEIRIQANLPSEGNVKMLVITEKQYAKMKLLVGPPPKNEEHVTYEQLTLF
jgi:CRISPR-associated protein Cas2